MVDCGDTVRMLGRHGSGRVGPRGRNAVEVVTGPIRRQPAQRPPDDAAAGAAADQPDADATDSADIVGVDAEPGSRPGVRGVGDMKLVDVNSHRLFIRLPACRCPCLMSGT